MQSEILSQGLHLWVLLNWRAQGREMITAQPFVLDERNQGVALSKRGKPAGESLGATIFLGLFFIPFIVVGIGLVLGSIQSAIEWGQMQQSGIVTSATVTQLKIDEDSEGDTFYATYRFSLSNAQGYHAYSKTKSVGKKLYYTLEKGGPLPIRYLKSDPNISRVGASEPLPGEAIGLGGFALLWNAIIGTIVWFLIHGFWLDRQYATKSQLLDGTLMQATTELDSDSDLQLKISYQFHAPDGEILYGDSSRTRNDLKGKAIPTYGTPVVVAFVDKKIHRLL